MKKYTIILLLFLFVVPAYALERYSSRMTPDGTIYFIMPKKLNKLHGIKHFEYDMTLLSWTDSVTVNFTFDSRILGVPTKLSIKSGDKTFNCRNYSLLFQDIKKNGYEIRVTSKFPVEEMKEVINNEVSPIFIFCQENKEESASYSDGSWKKDRKKLIDIFNLYNYTKSLRK